ncbi:hypothetical protein C8R47DRAFT_1296632 [Mycena vitilis]|nr:hypothetical protein C8R47DRAFT_1296632 [Mycena vitilis]
MLLSKLATYIFDTVLELAKEDEVGADDAAPELLSGFVWSLAGWLNSPIPTPTPPPSPLDDLYAVFVKLVLLCVYLVLLGVELWIFVQLFRAAPPIQAKPTMHGNTEQLKPKPAHEPAQSEHTTPTCAAIQIPQPIAIPAGKADPRTAEEEYALLRAMLHAILPAPPSASPLATTNPNPNPPPRTTTPRIPGPPAPSPLLAPEPEPATTTSTPIPTDPSPSTPIPAFASPEITCASTPRLGVPPPSPSAPSSPRLPRTTRLARRLLHLGAARVASQEELRVLYKWARVPSNGAPPPGYTDEDEAEDAAQEALERDVDATAVEDNSNIGVGRSPLLGEEKMRMWRGRRWAR